MFDALPSFLFPCPSPPLPSQIYIFWFLFLLLFFLSLFFTFFVALTRDSPALSNGDDETAHAKGFGQPAAEGQNGHRQKVEHEQQDGPARSQVSPMNTCEPSFSASDLPYRHFYEESGSFFRCYGRAGGWAEGLPKTNRYFMQKRASVV